MAEDPLTGGVHAEGSDLSSVQHGAYLLQLSLDWIVCRASENIDEFLGVSHVTLIDEPLGPFVHAQSLHDLRNLFSRLSATTGIARAYRVRLTDNPTRFDLAFQLSNGRILLEAVPSPEEGLGETFGSIGGLIDGLAHSHGQALLDGGARRLRALTGYDRACVTLGDKSCESSRGGFAPSVGASNDLPVFVADCSDAPVAIFPRQPGDKSMASALLRGTTERQRESLRERGIGAAMTIPFRAGGEVGLLECHHHTPRRPSFETHAAAELFAQLLAMRLEIDRLSGDQAS